jgi:hypothetical protein
MQNAQYSIYSRRRTEPRKNGNKTLLIARQFDDGKEETNSNPDNILEEYDILGRGAEDGSSYSIQKSDNFVEYDIFSREFADCNYNDVLKDLDFQNEGYVEPFQDSAILVLQQERPSPAKSIPIEPSYNLFQQKLSDQEILPGSKPDSEDLKKGVSNDELMADLKSILGGQKIYDPISNKMVNKADLATQKLEIQQRPDRPRNEEKELRQPDQKNEHEIFDRIRRSMEFANAYDLGDVSLERRFNEFDDLIELKERNKKKEKTINSNLREMGMNDQSKLLTTTFPNQNFIEDLDSIKLKSMSTSQPVSIPSEPGIGGRSIGPEALQEGDIIISTTTDKDSRLIEAAKGSEISYASMYIGDGMVVEAVSDGMLKRSLETSIANDTLAVAYRHVNMTQENARQVTDFLKRAAESKARYDYWSLIRVAPYQIINNYCSSLPDEKQEACRLQARNFRIGTDMNNEFYCSEPILKALKVAGLSISDGELPSAEQDVVRLNHNGTLLYIGYLKS